ncbi:response regulator [Pseudobacteriovorax antillogorgiicola]|uniref:Response regulator receiver domain-containing protein n=1 Tax=Pseudobacteriovorax antillogorgiicola TaxID=1513793 RepID=A0A1Y6BD28_9BACT|nr:response regulator [Pseudobacteriovorax antillogorgiicola]TCS56459.1 response regulator receiver domain-containing protein [Pseudobacteriovorax antillogorgiicola]SMF05218.1 Response regulator receiver domain-containing protein [Pseudobacteriovorax antillogorgiicola]
MELKVLIVDDDEDVREYTQDIISQWKGLGLDVTFAFRSAIDGLDGMNKLHEEPFDLVIADMKMPRMTGVQMVTALRSNPGPNQQVPIIVVSGYADSYSEAIKTDAWSHVFTLDKPLEQDRFHRVITFAVGQKMRQGA